MFTSHIFLFVCKAIDIDLWVSFNAWLIGCCTERESVTVVEESWKKSRLRFLMNLSRLGIEGLIILLPSSH